MVAFALEGKARDWFQMMQSNNLLGNWSEFLDQVKMNFGPSKFEDFQGELAKLVQKDTVSDYQAEFVRLMNRVTGVSQDLLISMFIGGLKPLLKQELLLHRPPTLLEAFTIAKLHETRLDSYQQVPRPPPRWVQHQPVVSAPFTTSTATSRVFSTCLQEQNKLLVPNSSSNKVTTTLPPVKPIPAVPIRKLTPVEEKERRDKGLCFRCDQLWSRNHRCQTRSVMLLSTDDEEGVLEESIVEQHVEEPIITGDISSLNTFARLGSPKSLRLWGEIQGILVHVLIDSGSTHNFIQPTLVENLHL